MDLNQARTVLDKINSLFNNMSEDEDAIAGIERDLMLSYIRQFYEAFLSLELPSTPAYKKVESKVEKTPPKPQAPRVIMPEVPKIQEIEKAPATEVNSIPVVETPPPPPPPPAPEPIPVPAPPPPIQRVVPSDAKKELGALFEFKAATELSEKLSERPISDLTKALAINDRLLYMNELFNKDLNALNDSLNLLNKYDNMEAAKGLLYNLAEQYRWMDENKLATAKDFIKLVRRRYQ